MRSNYLNTQNSYRESYVSKSTLVSPGSEADSDNQAQLILDSMQLATETFQAKVPSLILQAAQMEIDVIDDLIGDEFIALLIHIVTVSLVQAFIACNDAIISAVCHYALETLDIRDHILALELCHERVAERFPGAPPNVHANKFSPSFFEKIQDDSLPARQIDYQIHLDNDPQTLERIPQCNSRSKATLCFTIIL